MLLLLALVVVLSLWQRVLLRLFVALVLLVLLIALYFAGAAGIAAGAASADSAGAGTAVVALLLFMLASRFTRAGAPHLYSYLLMLMLLLIFSFCFGILYGRGMESAGGSVLTPCMTVL